MIQEKILIPCFAESLPATYNFVDKEKSICVLISCKDTNQKDYIDSLTTALASHEIATLVLYQKDLEAKHLISCIEDIFIQPSLCHHPILVFETDSNYLKDPLFFEQRPVLKFVRFHQSILDHPDLRNISYCLQQLLYNAKKISL